MLPSLATRQQGQLAEIHIPALGRPIFHAQTGALFTSRSVSPSFSGAGSSCCWQEKGALAVAPAIPEMA